MDGAGDISGFVMAQRTGTPSPPPRRKFNHPEPSASGVSVYCSIDIVYDNVLHVFMQCIYAIPLAGNECSLYYTQCIGIEY